MQGLASGRTFSFDAYLRTGRLVPAKRSGNAVETKFNPYHDPENGQFTFAPGGPQSLRHVIISDRRSSGQARVQLAQYRPNPRAGRGGNSAAFQDPMTLQQVFPGLRNAPAGAALSLADNIFDLSGPANRLTAALTEEYSAALIQQIQAIDPQYRLDSLSVPKTLDGQGRQINGLRLDRAVALYRIRGEIRPLQVETLRILQINADAAFENGLRKLKAGQLNIRLSPQEALGNWIDREVRGALRELYRARGISTARGQQVRVNSREYDASGADLTYRIPDVRVGNVAFDVTMTRKTLATRQVRGFFNTDLRPASVIIVRPSQLGTDNTYVITRPRN